MKARPAKAAEAMVLSVLAAWRRRRPWRRAAMRGAPASSPWASSTWPMASPCHISSNTQQERKEVIAGSWWAGVSRRSRR